MNTTASKFEFSLWVYVVHVAEQNVKAQSSHVLHINKKTTTIHNPYRKISKEPAANSTFGFRHHTCTTLLILFNSCSFYLPVCQLNLLGELLAFLHYKPYLQRLFSCADPPPLQSWAAQHADLGLPEIMYDCSRLSHTLVLSSRWGKSYSNTEKRTETTAQHLNRGERIIPMKFKVLPSLPIDYPSPQMLVSCVKALQSEMKGKEVEREDCFWGLASMGYLIFS